MACALFVADSVAAPTDALASHSARSTYFEPLTLLSALSAVTEHIGLIATATTTAQVLTTDSVLYIAATGSIAHSAAPPVISLGVISHIWNWRSGTDDRRVKVRRDVSTRTSVDWQDYRRRQLPEQLWCFATEH